MRSYKALASYKLLESGWVLTVLHTRQPHSDVTIFKADVVPSFRVNDTPHHPWAGVNQVGDVVAAHCDCKAGYVSLFVYLTICIPIEQCRVNYMLGKLTIYFISIKCKMYSNQHLSLNLKHLNMD